MPLIDFYILVNKIPTKTRDRKAWSEFLANTEGIVKSENIGNIKISTVFLGIDTSYGLAQYPQCFETMVFGGNFDKHQERYSSWDEALHGHQSIVRKVKASFFKTKDI